MKTLLTNEIGYPVRKMLGSTLVLAIIFITSGCAPSHKFDRGELSKLGKIAVISHSEHRFLYIPRPSEIEGEEKVVKELGTFLEGFPLAKIMRQKFRTALIGLNLALDLVPEPAIEKIEDTSMQSCLTWAERNHVDAVIHLQSMLEVSHVYRIHDIPLRYYPKIWTTVKIIRLKDNKLLWSKTVWTHAMDGTAAGLKSYSPYDTVFDKENLEPLIYKKLDYVVKALIKDLG